MIAGRYSIEREIGRGGTGAVWLGRDEVLGRPVALKRIGLLPGADQTDLARAEREARLSARLNHPHVVAIFDVVHDNDSRGRWLVMEYVDGIHLGQVVERKGPLAPDDAAPLLAQVADALAAAHAAGIVHRDVKPSNIMVDRRWRMKLTDFGIARVTADPALTQTGLVTGSPSYLSPEVASGHRGDEAVDVWAFGATAFYVLSGRPPYEVDGNVLGALYRIVHDEPPRLPQAGWLAPLLANTMVRDPARRWSMARVRDFLDDPASREAATAVLGAAPSVGPDPEETSTQRLTVPAAAGLPGTDPSPGERPAQRTSRRPSPKVVAAVALAVLLVLAVGLVLGSILDGNDSKTPATAPKTPTTSPTPTPTPTPTKSPRAAPKPTEQGIKRFISDYVDAVSTNPEKSWQMLTPKFQTESGGFTKYRNFWAPATNGRVVDISANPDNLSVSYQVRFDNFDNGPGPTVLDLKFDKGRYRIDGERSEGFVPAD